MSGGARVLVADDEASIRFVLREALEEAGHEVVEAACGETAWRALAGGGFAIAFVDLRMPEPTGLELLERLRETGSDTAVVVITAQNTVDAVVGAMQRGAFDYLTKPFGLAEVLALVEKALRFRALQGEVRALRRGAAAPAGGQLVGRSAALLEVFKLLGRVAARDVPVLVTGESGTGKELVARAIHRASGRAAGPFVAVNAAAIPGELLESELFGHERGAFTGATEARLGRFREAAGGTLFLDEIGDMPQELQAKLLRVLQSGELTALGGRHAQRVDVRIVAATHRDLDAELREGRFREDLLYRLRVVPIHIPPLRERAEDIPVLTEHFVARYAVPLGSPARFLSEAAFACLGRHRWPGNARELENAIKRALVLANGEVLDREDFAFLFREGMGGGAGEAATASLEEQVRGELRRALALAAGGGGGSESIYRQILARVEGSLLEEALVHTSGNQLQAAALLGINRNTLHNKLGALQLSVRNTGAS